MRYRAGFGLLVVVLAVLLGRPQPTHAQLPVDRIIITQVAVPDFPQVYLRVRPLDAGGRPVANLTLDALDVRENGEEISLESLHEIEAGLWLHFVVDAGASLSAEAWQDARQAILAFLQNEPWMRPDLDHVAVTAVEAGGRRTLVNFTNDTDEVAAALEDYQRPGGSDFSEPLPVLSDILEEMDVLAAAQRQPRFVFFLTAALEKGSSAQVETLSDKAVALGIPIHTVLLRAVPRDDIDRPILDLGEQSRGTFTVYRDTNPMKTTYDTLAGYRVQYDLSYRSYLGVSGTRQVVVAPTGGPPSAAGQTSYTVEVNPPRVKIESPPAGGSIVRQAAEYTTDLGSIPPTTETVVASVVFPDDYLRRLRRATLLVNSAVGATVDNPGADVELSWNLRDIQQLGVNDFTLQVEVEDELGLVAVSQPVTAKVEVIVPPRPTSTPSLTPTPTPTPTVTPQPPCLLPEPICTGIERPVRNNSLPLVSILIASVSLVFAGVVWLNRDKAPVQGAIGTIRTTIANLTRRREAATARAYLIVLEGDTRVGHALEIYGDTPIGRSRQDGAELVFQQHDANSPISRLHCTLINEEDHFLIRDDDSSQGTYLNGNRLRPLVPEALQDGDEIELARVQRGGLLFRFQLARPGDGQDDEWMTATKKTRSPQSLEDTEIMPPGDRF